VVSIAVRDDQHWRDLRRTHVGSSDVAALFNMHAYGLTRWQLWHIKNGTLPDAFETSVMSQGKHFEPAIASYAQDKFSIQLRKVRRYLEADDCPSLGASVDYEQLGDGALIPTELKWSLWGKEWEYDGDELTHVPDNYLLQVQHQLAAMPSAPHAQLIAFTGGDLKRMIIPRSDTIISAIKEKVAEFMQSIIDGVEPPVDFAVDAGAVMDLAASRPLAAMDLPPDMQPVFDRFQAAKAAVAAAEVEQDAAKAELVKYVMDNSYAQSEKCVAKCGPYKMTINKIDATPPTVITPEMVGTSYGGRKGYARVTISKAKD
jgi:predicted phage-related endonuclease